MKKQYILFDLDGTLTDPKEGITKGVAHALAAFDIQVEDLDTLTPFIGPPLYASFSEFYGFDEAQIEKGVRTYREYYTDKGMWENYVYDGIPELLQHLKAAGKTILLATSKPEKVAKQILEKFELLQYFDYAAGAAMDLKDRYTKADVIAHALEMCGSPDPSDIVMVGDRKFDVEGAAPFGIETIGVTYGYGTKEELEEAGAVCTVRNVEQLEAVLLDKKSPLTTLCYIERDGKYLMMHRTKKEKDINREKWIGIGGHFEPNESPEDCVLREVREETNLTLTDYKLRGIVTFISDDYQTEYMHLYTSTGFEGELASDCCEGELAWVDKSAVYDLPIWEGDKIFFRLLEEREDFFSLKLTYINDKLTEAVLDGKKMEQAE